LKRIVTRAIDNIRLLQANEVQIIGANNATTITPNENPKVREFFQVTIHDENLKESR
jgi:hypothetical protein